MSVTLSAPSDNAEAQRRDALSERLFLAMVEGIELLSIDLGRRLGLYTALHTSGPLDDSGLATAAGITERYAREWLEQQAVAGLLDVVEGSQPRRYTLPAAHVPVLVDAESPAYMLAAAPMLTGVAVTVERVAEAFRTGGGVGYADFGADVRHGIGTLNRPMFSNELAQWLETMPDVQARLASGGRVLDVGCGMGWSTIALARAFPRTEILGIDLDEASIAEARANVAAAGLTDRVTVEVGDAAALVGGGYDLVCLFEALHDMGEPIQSLGRVHAGLAPGGTVLVADERAAPVFTAPGDELERFLYGCSVLHCLPATMAESTAVASGTVLRESTVREWAATAGFAAVEVLPIEHDFWRFYRLVA